MNDVTSKIVNALNESVNDQFMETERTVGVSAPKQVHQCDDCACFYLVDEKTNESVCPECGGDGKPYGDINECDGAGQISSKEIIDESEDEEELRSEAEEIVSEALSCLDRNDYQKFNECYRPRVRMTRRGELQGIVESVTVSRRMTSRQKTAYRLAEKYVPTARKSMSSKKNEAIKLSRQNLMIKNESRAIKMYACRLLERQGVRYNYKKFNEGMNKFINSRNVYKMLEDIAQDDEIGKSELDKMTPDEIGDAVTSVIKDTGLDVVTNDVDIDGDTATVNVRVEDNGEQEVRTSEVESTLKDVFDTKVEIVGPYKSEGDETLSDLSVVINPDDDVNEGFEDDLPTGSTPTDPGPDELDLQIKEDREPVKNPDTLHKFESVRRRRRRSIKENKMNLYALVLKESQDDDAPKFLGNDDSLVEGDDEDAEEKARLFVSEDAANKFLEEADLDSEYEAKSVSITSEGMEEEDDYSSEEEITEEGADEVIKTDDATYFKKEGVCYRKDDDDLVEEIDDSEYEDAKATADAEELKESYRRRRRSRR